MAFLTKPGALLISEGLAADNGLKLGDPIMLDAGGRQSTGFVAGLLRPSDALSRRALDGLILADLATAQEITGRIGRLDTIDLILSEGDLEGFANLRGLLPADAQIVPVRLRSGALAQMTAAFRTNLTALSLLALVVGMFLIYNSMTFSVVQRRPLFGTLRCLGVTRGEIGVLVLGEAVMVGAVGSLLGLALGVILGQGAVQAVTQTINDLYFVVTVRGIAIPVASLAKGALAGVFATVAAAACCRHGRRRPSHRVPGAHPVRPGGDGAAAGAVDGACGRYRDCSWRRAVGSPHQEFGGQLCGHLLPDHRLRFAGPGLYVDLLPPGRRPAQAVFGVLGRMAPRSVTGALSRTAVAVAALDGGGLRDYRRGADGRQLPHHRRFLARTNAVGRFVRLRTGPHRHPIIRPARSAGDRCCERVARRGSGGICCGRWTLHRRTGRWQFQRCQMRISPRRGSSSPLTAAGRRRRTPSRTARCWPASRWRIDSG